MTDHTSYTLKNGIWCADRDKSKMNKKQKPDKENTKHNTKVTKQEHCSKIQLKKKNKDCDSIADVISSHLYVILSFHTNATPPPLLSTS